MSKKESNRETMNAEAGLKRLSSSHWVVDSEHEKAAKLVAKVLAPFKARAIKKKNEHQKSK